MPGPGGTACRQGRGPAAQFPCWNRNAERTFPAGARWSPQVAGCWERKAGGLLGAESRRAAPAGGRRHDSQVLQQRLWAPSPPPPPKSLSFPLPPSRPAWSRAVPSIQVPGSALIPSVSPPCNSDQKARLSTESGPAPPLPAALQGPTSLGVRAQFLPWPTSPCTTCPCPPCLPFLLLFPSLLCCKQASSLFFQQPGTVLPQGLCTGLCSLPGKPFTGTSQVAPLVKNPPAMQETPVPFLGQEGPLEKNMHPTPVFLPGEFPWTEETGGLQSVDSQRVGHTEQLSTSTDPFTSSNILFTRHLLRKAFAEPPV